MKLANVAPTVKDYASTIGVLAAAFGGFLYLLLTVLCLEVYDPFGVEPSEVGLDYSVLLMRTAVGVLALVPVWLFFGGLGAYLASVVVQRFSKAAGWTITGIVAFAAVTGSSFIWEDGVEAARLWPTVAPLALGLAVGWLTWLMAVPGTPEWPAARIRSALVLAGVLIAAATTWIFVGAATVDSDLLKQGRLPRDLGGERPPPWNADVVRVRWVNPQAAPIDLPPCLLHLGTADGVGVFYDASGRHERTLKIPNASVLVEVLPNVDSAVPRDSGGGPCA